MEEVSSTWRDSVKIRIGMDNNTNNIIKKMINSSRVNNKGITDINGVRLG